MVANLPELLKALPRLRDQLARNRIEELKRSPARFRDSLTIDMGGGRSALLGKVAEAWQREDFESLDPAWRSICGLGPPAATYDAYLERARGHSKTTDIAAMVTWALFAAPRKVTGIAAASDREQAAILRNGIDTLIRLNPWLAEHIQVFKFSVVNRRTGSELKVIASDDASAYGHVVDFVIVDELTHWSKEEMWVAAYSTAAKRTPCLCVVISNAGNGKGLTLATGSGEELGGSWQWKVRESCRKSATWHFRRLDGPVASWITPAVLAKQRDALPSRKQYARLWLNQWQTEGGEGLSMDDVMACAVLEGPARPGTSYAAYVGGLDLGQTHDHAAFVLLGVDIQRKRLVLLAGIRWKPEDYGGRILLEAVEKGVIEEMERFGLTTSNRGLGAVVYDPYQCERSAEEIRKRGIRCERYEFNVASCHEMAAEVLHSFRMRDIEIFGEPSLLADLQKIEVVERTTGKLKLQAPKDDGGHCDMATALAIALPWARATLLDYTDQTTTP